MVRFFRLSILIAAVAGLAACSAKATAPKSAILDDFERVPDPGLLSHQFNPVEALKKPTYPQHDFDVQTSGYATVTSLSKDSARAANQKDVYKFIQGKTAAQVRFTVPGDYRKKDENFPKTWETGFGLSTESRTPLKVTDWSPFRYFNFRVFNPAARAQTLYIRYNDSAAAVTLTSVVVPQGESEVELSLDQLSVARLNPADIRGVTLYLDTAGQDVDPVLYFDELALYDMSSAQRIKLAKDEGAQEDQDEDWDSEDEDTVRQVRVLIPGQTPAVPAAVSATAGAAAAAAQ
jgi:hypothetical protein